MDDDKAVRLERHGVVATVVLSRVERMNALTYDMWKTLARIADTLQNDDEIRVVVFRGDGDKAFSAGADISEFANRRNNSAQAKIYGDAVAAAFGRIVRLKQPTIAMIRGACVGGGCELAIATDLRIAAIGSRFGVPVARLGLVVGYEELSHLVRLVGVGATMDLLLTGRLVDAQEALQIGLISRLVGPDDLEQATQTLAAKITAGAPLAHAWHKQMVRTIQATPDLADLSEEQLALQYDCFDSADFREGYRSFLAKQPPQFQGR